MPTTYLVTGAAGNLGSAVARRLLADGERVRGLVLPGDPAVGLVPEGVEIVEGDLTDPESLEPLFDGTGKDVVVIHTAAVVTVHAGFSQLVHDVNVDGTRHVVEACLAHGVRRLVHVGSTGAVPGTPDGSPISEPVRYEPRAVVGYYGQSKAEGINLVLDAVRDRGLDAVIVLPTGIVGPGDIAGGPVTSFIREFCGRGMRIGVEGSFNAVDVRDLADATVAAVTRGRRGEAYILGNEVVPMRRMLDLVADATGRPRVGRILPGPVAWLLGRATDLLGRLTGKEGAMTSFAVYNLLRNNDFDSSKARRELGFTTRPFEESIRDTVTWLAAEGLISVPAPVAGTDGAASPAAVEVAVPRG